MDSLHASEKSVNENINKKVDKRSSVVLRSSWFTLLGTFALFSGSQSLDIKGELHKDVLLPCIVVYKDEFDYNLLVVNWQRPENDTVVHTFYHGSSHPKHQEAHYKGRTQIFYESLPNGNASLLLRNLTNSDAGCYICHVVLKQSSGYLTKYVNLTVHDAHVPEITNTNWILIAMITVTVVILVIVAAIVAKRYKCLPKKSVKEDEEAKLLEKDPDPIKKYRQKMSSKSNKYTDMYDRQLLVVKRDIYLGDQQRHMNAKKLFTTENQHLMSRRMLLVGDVGTGKTYFCKWLEIEWLKNAITLYQCIVYLSGKKINKKNEKTSVKKILEHKYMDLSEVVHMPGVLLILDEFDDILYDEDTSKTNLPLDKDNLDVDAILPLNTLIESIMNKQLFPETDVLFVSRHDSPINKLFKLCTSTIVLQEFNDSEATNVYDTVGHLSADKYKSIKNISNNPAFVLMMCNQEFVQFVHLYKEQELTSPYEAVISFFQQFLKVRYDEGGHVEELILQLGKESYENLIKGEENKLGSTCQWKEFVNLFQISKFQFFRDMLAALYCVWQSKGAENLKHCLDFWLFGTHIASKHNCPLLYPVAKEHRTKYYHFIRFFMRLLLYPDYNSLCNNAPNLDDNLRNLLRDYFKNNLKDHNENYEKLAVLNCVFELHDDNVTKALSAIDNFSLLNTPLNSLDIRSIVYCFKDVKLQMFDLRLCALTDDYVKQLKNIIKNTVDVRLSSNGLISETGNFLGNLLQEPECLIEKLALGSNDLGPKGAQALWRALEHNTSLRSLYLYDNNIGEDGTFEMVEHLLKNNSLKELHLCLNKFDVKATENIKTLKTKKTNLKVVVRILEDLELFDYVEKMVDGLSNTWTNYNQMWLTNLLQIVQEDLQNKDWPMDGNLTQERVDKLIMQIKTIIGIIKKEKSMGENKKYTLFSIFSLLVKCHIKK